jgi:hypothetical protein
MRDLFHGHAYALPFLCVLGLHPLCLNLVAERVYGTLDSPKRYSVHFPMLETNLGDGVLVRLCDVGRYSGIVSQPFTETFMTPFPSFLMLFCTFGGLEDILGDGRAQLGEVNEKDRKGTVDNEAT